MSPNLDLVLLVGAPRSGTTWLQNMLGAHPDVVTPQELDVHNGYLQRWHDLWERQLGEDGEEWGTRRYKGLPSVLTEEEFREVVREAVWSIYARVAALKPSARVVLDKTPAYARYSLLINRYFPEARFVHLVRDGRDVAASLVHAGKSWGRAWAPADLASAARLWKEDVDKGRRVRGRAAYLEVRYEDLLEEAPAQLVESFAFCGVEIGLEEAKEISERFSFDRMRADRGRTTRSLVFAGEAARRHGEELCEPEGFFRRGESGTWRSWGGFQRWLFAEQAGDLLSELGYAAPGWGTRRWLAPLYRLRSWTGRSGVG